MEPKFAEIAYSIENAFRRIAISVSMLTGSIILIALAGMIPSYQARVMLALASLVLWGIGSRKLYLSGKELIIYIVLDDHATDMRIINKVRNATKQWREIREPDLSGIKVEGPGGF